MFTYLHQQRERERERERHTHRHTRTDIVTHTDGQVMTLTLMIPMHCCNYFRRSEATKEVMFLSVDLRQLGYAKTDDRTLIKFCDGIVHDPTSKEGVVRVLWQSELLR